MAQQPTRNRSAALPWLLLVGCAVAVFVAVHFRHSPQAARGLASNNSDAWQYHLAVRAYGFDRLREGDLPLWNPYILAGQPFLATHQAAVLYPLNFPHWFLPHGTALGVVMALHIGWAALGMFGWLYSRRNPPHASAIGAVVFALAPAVVNPLQWPHVLLGNSWLPWVCWGIDGVVDRTAPRRAALLAIACTCLLLSGYVQGALYIYYAVIPYAAVRWWQSRETSGNPARAAWLVAGLGVLPFFASALQMWPLVELVQHSARSAEGIDPRAVATLGHIPGSLVWQSLVGRGQPNPLLFAPGIATWLLVVLACTPSRLRSNAFWLVIGCGAALLAAGFDTPLYELYYRLPTGATFRLPIRLLLLTACAAGVLAASGASYLTSADNQSRRLPTVVFVLIVGLLLLAASKQWVVGVIALAAVAVWARPASWTPACATVVLGCTAFTAVTNYQYVSTLPWHQVSPFADDQEITAYLDAHRDHQRVHIYREHGDWRQWRYAANWGMQTRVPQLTGYESLPLAATAAGFTGIDRDVAERSGIPFVGGLGLNAESRRPDLLNLWAVRYVIVDEGINASSLTAQSLPEWLVRPLGLTQVAPRVWRSANALERAYLLHTPPAEVLQNELPPMELVENSSVTVVRDEPERVALHTESEQPGHLVLHDAYYPGWRATLDGQQVPIGKAYGLFRTIPVPAGSHTIEFTYRPLSVRAGMVSTVFAAGLLLAMLVRRSRNSGT